MGQMAITGHTSIIPAKEEDWHTQFQGRVLAERKTDHSCQLWLSHKAAVRE